MKVAFFRCATCNHTVQAEIDRGKIDEPLACPRDVCAMPGSMQLVHNRCEFADRQVIRLQETPDAVPDGQTPHTVSLSVYDELVDVSKPGDRVVVTGIYRSVPVRVNPNQRTIKSLFRTYLDVVHLHLGHDSRLGFDKTTRPAGGDRVPGIGVGGRDEEDHDGRGMRKEELEDKLKELSKREDIYELLSRSLAPNVWSMDDVKKGILLQLLGGTNKSIARGGGGGGPRYRGDINVLLVGDPGTSKSQILHVSQTQHCIVDMVAKCLVVCSQASPSRSLHLRKRFLSCWSYRICHARSGHQAACARKVYLSAQGHKHILT
jgi:DNA replication licensing factor MCM4